MERIAEGLFRLGRRRHNFYLVVAGGRATVIDAGGSRELPLLEAALAALRLPLDAVEAVLLTHAHTDHLGFAHALERRGITVRAHEDEAAYVRDESAGSQLGAADFQLWRPRVVAFLVELVRAGAARGYRVTDVQTVTDGERLDLPGAPQVIATPGHTAGHASYLLTDHRALCAGDALVTDGLIRGGPGPQLLADSFHHDAARARESLDRLVGLDADVVLPGHGAPWRGPVDEAVARARAAGAEDGPPGLF